MRSPETLAYPIDANRSIYTPEGAQIGPAKPLEEPKEVNKPVNLDSTTRHETGHTLVGWIRGVGIDAVDTIPKGNALGTTYPDQFDAPTAAAGYATGTGGHSHDQFVTEEIYHQNFYAAAATAGEIIKNNQEAFTDLGTALQTDKYLPRRRINAVLTNSMERKRRRKNMKTLAYEIPIKTKDGREETVRLEVPKGVTMLHVPLPKSGDIFVASKDTFYSESSRDF